jgi:hypothetical protein
MTQIIGLSPTTEEIPPVFSPIRFYYGAVFFIQEACDAQ